MGYLDRGEILGIQFAAQFWMEIVQPNFEMYRNHPVAREAFNLATALWHQIDWAVSDPSTNHKGLSLSEFRREVESKCPSLSILHDIATKSKHYNISRPRGAVAETKTTMLGATFYFTSQGPISEHPAEYAVVFEDGSEEDLNTIFVNAMEFWKGYFHEHSERQRQAS